MREHLRAHDHLLILGEAGMGETALVREAAAGLPDAIYCADSSKMSTICDLLLAQLGGQASSANNRERRRALANTLRGRRVSFILDHIGWVTPRLLAFFEYLRESHALVVITRNLRMDDTGHLHLILWRFATIELQPLDIAATRKLVSARVRELGVNVPDLTEFQRAVRRISRGNPRVIGGLCEQAKRGNYVFGDRFDVRLLDLDRRIRELTKETVI